MKQEKRKIFIYLCGMPPKGINVVGYDLLKSGVSIGSDSNGPRLHWSSVVKHGHQVGTYLKKAGIPISYFMKSSEVSPMNKSLADVKIMHVYTDGAYGDKLPEPPVGCGVFFGDNDKKNVCERIFDSHQSFLSAELNAIKLCLFSIIRYDLGNTTNKYVINADSLFAIQDVTSREKCAKSESYEDVLQHCKEYLDVINTVYKARGWGELEFKWVKAHSGIYGNEMANILPGRTKLKLPACQSDFVLNVSGGRSATCNPGLIHGLKMLTKQQSELITSKATTPSGSPIKITGFGTIVFMLVPTETQEQKCVSFPIWYAPDDLNFVGHGLLEQGISLKVGPKGQRIACRSSINNHKIGLDLKSYGIPISYCVRPAKPATGNFEVTNPNFSTVEVFTDGACKNNNTTNPNIVRVAGCGVCFGDDDEKNVCEFVTKSDYPGIKKVTNNIAELHAIKLALLTIMEHDLGRTRTKVKNQL
ncbi:unnamed protein product [Ambrosiozyma monospora]|uniref:Unnamed protein product n=1 Tax=Ambrosiozyma monospora TaxID=43982 RepID=A0ACB5SZA6_AMBMO|nr:unnamed protein product [Ambrosiozyma monospora]